MTWVENLLIIAGVSLDIFAAMECQGSLVKKVNKKQLSLICLLVSVWQLAALFIGFLLSDIFLRKNPSVDETLVGEIISVVIFLCLGFRLIFKALKKDCFVEHLEVKLEIKRFVKMAAGTSIYTILAGIAFGLILTNLIPILIMIVLTSVVFIVAGMYTGYHFGFEQRTKAYIAGAILLWLAGADIVIRTLIQ